MISAMQAVAGVRCGAGVRRGRAAGVRCSAVPRCAACANPPACGLGRGSPYRRPGQPEGDARAQKYDNLQHQHSEDTGEAWPARKRGQAPRFR